MKNNISEEFEGCHMQAGEGDEIIVTLPGETMYRLRNLLKERTPTPSSLTAKLEAAEKMAEALKYYANEKMYEEMKVYRGEPMSEAYQIEVYPILEGEKYHVAQEALAHWHTVNGAAKERGHD